MPTTRRSRIVPLLENVKKILLRLKPKAAEKDGFVFCKDNGFPFNPDHVTHVFKEAVIKAGLDPKVHFHTLRHSTASNLVQRGVSIYFVKELLGHSTVTTTEIYSHLNIESKKREMNKLLTDKLVRKLNGRINEI